MEDVKAVRLRISQFALVAARSERVVAAAVLVAWAIYPLAMDVVTAGL